MSLPKVNSEQQDRFEYYCARHFIHNNVYYIELPPELDIDDVQMYCQYKNVDFESNSLGSHTLELDHVEYSRNFISLPSWVLL